MKMNMKIKIACLTIIGVLVMLFMMSNPLSAKIDLTTGLPPSELTQKEIEPLIEVNNRGKILWDTFHGIYLDYSPSGRFSNLKSILEYKGYTVDENDSGMLNLNLSNYDIIVICLGSAYESPYSPTELVAIEDFVNNGGSLLIMGDNVFSPNYNIYPIAQRFGTTLGLSFIAEAYITNFIGHSIFSGVSEIYMSSAGEINAIPPSSEAAWTDDGTVYVTVVESSSLRVIVLGDINIMDNDYIIKSDNQLFTENVFDWLAPTPPCFLGTLQ